MDLSKFSSRIFAIKPSEEKKPEVIPPVQKPNYQEYGFSQSGKLGGTLPGLRVCLQRIFHDFKSEIRDDLIKQEELKRPFKVKIEDYKGDIVRLEGRIEKIKTESIPAANKKIESFKEELADIRKNPQLVTGDDAGRASFIIGGIILLFLTVYLFVFYSSASYSAFFKQFSLNEIGVANSIFDANALTRAFKDGFTELILILTIPFVFLGLGYLIHKFMQQKGFQKYLKAAILILVTFAFDTILAYEITEKIYNIRKENSFDRIPDYNTAMAFSNYSFWLIIFAGFVVYLIWGFVFDFIMDAYGKMDKVKIAIQEKEKQIKSVEEELLDYGVQIDKMSHVIAENRKEINKLQRILDSTIIPREFEQNIFQFMTGWLAWMRGIGKSQDELTEAEHAADDFIKNTGQHLEFSTSLS
jgi:hypothetical protein